MKVNARYFLSFICLNIFLGLCNIWILIIGRVSFWGFPGHRLGRRSLHAQLEVGGVPKIIVLEAMSDDIVRSSTEEIPSIRVDDELSRDETFIQSRSRAATEMMLALRRRSVSESNRAGEDDAEESQDREGTPKYEITQTGLKFNGNVKGVKFVATQVASKEGQFFLKRHEFTVGEQKHQSHVKAKPDNGFIKQSGALFLQSLTDAQAEVNQSAGGKDFFKVDQEAVEVDGEVLECSFPVVSQRVW
ncbi:hypothetical protein N431DRAFT_444294 [Stipitochalara longipes BDJ]|nr:hypothetical protein N431DRAFT_444294 [Stipitochalara longipes BDJ]